MIDLSKERPTSRVETLVGPDGEVIAKITKAYNSDNILKEISRDVFTATPRQNQPLVRDDTGGTLFTIGKTAWDIIQNDGPVPSSLDTSISVLYNTDNDPMNYEGSQVYCSKYEWKVWEEYFFGKVKNDLAKTTVNFFARYRAMPSINSKAPSGLYLPQVSVYTSDTFFHVSYKGSGSARVYQPHNTGTGGKVCACVDIDVELKTWQPLFHEHDSSIMLKFHCAADGTIYYVIG